MSEKDVYTGYKKRLKIVLVINSPWKKEIILFYTPQSIIGGNLDRKSNQEPRGRDWSTDQEEMLLTDLLLMAWIKLLSYIIWNHQLQ